MAKLTGSAPPAPPPAFFVLQQSFSSAPLPTLESLRERAAARMAQMDGGGGHPGLKRNNTVTGIGGAARMVTVGFGVSVDEPSAFAEHNDDKPIALDRAEARVNLMRKLSSRRLESPAPSDLLHRAETIPAIPTLAVVGRIGKARPRSGSVGALDWREGFTSAPAVPRVPNETLPPLSIFSPLGMSFDTGTYAPAATQESDGTEERSATSFSMRSSGNWAAERDRQSVLARVNGEGAWEFDESTEERDREDDHDDEEEVIQDQTAVEPSERDRSGELQETPRGEANWDVLTPRQSRGPFPPPMTDLPSPPISPTDDGTPSPPIALRRGSIPQHLLPSSYRYSPAPSSTTGVGVANARRAAAPLFGIGAVEETDQDVRRRGSSASSSVAFLEGRGARNSDGEPRLGGIGGVNGRHGSVSLGASDSALKLSDLMGGDVGTASGRGKGKGKGIEVEDPAWALKEKRLAAKVERKREAGLARSKQGAFPPPEENYQFPSPTIGVSHCFACLKTLVLTRDASTESSRGLGGGSPVGGGQ
jgi:hypothetical protein